MDIILFIFAQTGVSVLKIIDDNQIQGTLNTYLSTNITDRTRNERKNEKRNEEEGNR